jgi:peptidoglycan/xylan/chitin deacetylase (PgdA/CDA1 family)
MGSISYPRSWRWPNSQKLALSVGLAFEAFERHSQFSTSAAAERGKVNHFSLSFADYGWKAGIWRLLDLLDRYGLKANMSTSGLAAERHPEVVAAVAKAGHELNAHGWVNDRVADDDHEAAEREEIKRCTMAITAAAGMRPVGWTGPGSTGSKNTLSILKAEGYLWNGDDASDDLPFVKDTAHGPIVIMPRTNLPQNDLAMWLAPRNPPSILWEGFRGTFDTLYAEGEAGAPKWMEITLHCHIAGRPTLQPVIRQCLDYATRHDGIWFARRCDIAAWTLEHEGISVKR